MAEVINGWQYKYKMWKERVAPQLRSGHLADCTFQVGAEPHQVTIFAHKLVLGAASPVFETMFYGKMAETNDFVRIPDIQPNTFKALLEFIYTNDTKLNSFDLACDLYYAAKKYMLPNLVKKCSEYMIVEVSKTTSYACRAYEFALIFEDELLIDKCIQIISYYTTEMLSDGNFEEVEFNTVLKILSLERMNINSEVELFLAVERYAKAQEEKFFERNSTPSNNFGPENKNTSATVTKELTAVGDDSSLKKKNTITNDPCETVELNKPTPGPSGDDCKRIIEDAKTDVTVRSALEKIRFLVMPLKDFAEGPAKSPLLTKSEVHAVFMNLASTEAAVPMPSGWSTCRQPRLKMSKPF